MRYCFSTASAQNPEIIIGQPPVGAHLRRSPRLVCAVPLTVLQSASTFDAGSAVISAHGALIISPEPIPEGTLLILLNRRTGARAEAEVAWTGLTPLSRPSPSDHDSLPCPEYKLGVEFHQPTPEFWGSDYAPLSERVTELQG